MIRHARSHRRSLLNQWRIDEAHQAPYRRISRPQAQSLTDELLSITKSHPCQLALITDSAAYTYANLKERVCQFATDLRSLPGWRCGERVAIRLTNGIDYIAAFYGTLLAGGVAVPLPIEQRNDWIEGIFTKTSCRWIVDRTASTEIRPTGIQTPSEASLPHPGLAAIFFTSGSSGDPKGVMLSHSNLIANANSIVKSLPLLGRDRALAVLPFCHAYGNSVLQSHLLTGATLVISGSPTFPETLVEAMRAYAVTSFAGVPDLHRLLLRGSRLSFESVPTLRYATVAGGALQPELTRQMAERLNPAEFYVMYGQTEATARLSCLPAADLETHCGSIGRGIPDVTLQVVDAEGRSVAPGEIGELRASGPNIMQGYWKDADASRNCLRNGWLYTGDLATIDEEGYIYPRGRSSQLLKISGYRIHPAEIETLIAEKLPVCDPIVVPCETPDGATRLAMFVSPAAAAPMPSVGDIRQCCQHHLPRHYRPDIIEILDTPPLTASLKVDRQALSQRATNRYHDQYASSAIEVCHA